MLKRWLERGAMWVKVEYKDAPGIWSTEGKTQREKPPISVLLPVSPSESNLVSSSEGNPLGKPGRWLARGKVRHDKQ